MQPDFLAFILAQHPTSKRNSKQEYVIPCPFHNDGSRPNCRIDEQKEVYFCDVCNAGGHISKVAIKLGFVGITKTAYRYPQPDTTYDYTDESGYVLYQVCRMPENGTGKKQFFQRRKAPDNWMECEERAYCETRKKNRCQNGWIWGLAKSDCQSEVRRVLFNTKQLAAKKNHYAVIVEGEKDCLTLQAQGFLAVTNPMGAGKWEESYTEQLIGWPVVILPDNDEPGQEHALRVAHALWKKAKVIKIISLPELPPKGDVTDWFAAGNTKQQLIEIIKAAPEWEPAHPVISKPIEPLEFPESAYLGWAGEYAALYSQYRESPKPFWYFSALTCLGALLGSRLTLQVGNYPQPRMFTVLVGESADDRKSTCIHETSRFFKEAVGDEYKTCGGLGSAEGLATILNDEPQQPLLLVYDELRSFVAKANIQGSVLLPAVNTLFEENNYENATKGHTFKIHNAYLSVLAACTKETYQTMFDPSFGDMGFLNRLFVVNATGKRRFAMMPMIPNEEYHKLRVHLCEVWDWACALEDYHRLDGRYAFEISTEARILFDTWYMNEFPQTSHAKRLDTYAMRLMVLLAVSCKSIIITETIASAVIDILRYELEVRKEVEPIEAYNKVAAMEERVRRVLLKGPRKKNGTGGLHQYCNANKHGVFMFETAIENLFKAQQIRQNPDGNISLISDN